MPLEQPSSSICYKLKLPDLPADLTNNKATKDELKIKRLSLDYRTGAALQLSRSSIFAHGGLIIPLNLTSINSTDIQREVILYFAKEKNKSSIFKNLNDWISPEIFRLDLITRKWGRISTSLQDETNLTVMQGRLFHSICKFEQDLYVFGGLLVSPKNDYELVATNELWKLDMVTRKWSLLSSDPQITRRFNHTIHIQSSTEDSKDCKLIIVGGLNNLDQPVHHIDVFNIKKNFWESTKSPNQMVTNIDGKVVSLTEHGNIPLLLENTETEVPTLAFYMSMSDQKKQVGNNGNDEGLLMGEEDENAVQNDTLIGETATFTSRSNSAEKKNTPIKEKKKLLGTKIGNSHSSIMALPLIPRSQGLSMPSSQDHKFLAMPLDLQCPTGVYFNYTLIIAGFYQSPHPSNFHCFIYDLAFAKWSKIGLSCPDSDIKHHRYWKLFSWGSHHQALLLGTEHDDGYLPSVQKFDSILTFDLPMINVFNKVVRNSSIQTNPLCIPATPTTPGTGENTYFPFRKPSFASSTTSQFESYIKYITAPLEVESTSSVFAPYAMVLGKDALEIFGSYLADFELITSEGDSIAVPLYLLRKRWGRYFDLILSKGYSTICDFYDYKGCQSSLVKYPHQGSRAGSSTNLQPVDENFSTNSSIHSFLDDREASPRNRRISMTESLRDPNYNRLSPSSSTYNMQTINESKISSKNNPPTMSSSSGMVFRIPFQEIPSHDKASKSRNTEHASSSRRRSSFGVVPATSAQSTTTNNIVEQAHRRASHPTICFNANDNNAVPGKVNTGRRPSLRFATNAQSSRKASIASQTSTVSGISSISDKLSRQHTRGSLSGTGSLNNSRPISPIPSILGISVPPPSQLPTDPLPPPPRSMPTSRRGSFVETYNSVRASPFSSRRSSRHRLSLPEAKISRQNSFEYFFGVSPNDARKYSSHSNEGSVTSSIISNAINDMPELEPLLTPRSLYMPWPTATVRAFAEFFYTGQVNGKCLLTPVILDLLVMARIYEVPLLYTLITEVLYSVIGKKEESLALSIEDTHHGFHELVSRAYHGNEGKVGQFLNENATFSELLRLKKSLEIIEDGLLDLDLLNEYSGAPSVSTNEDSLDDEESRKNDLSNDFNSSRSSMSFNKFASNVISGGPRESQHSLGSLASPISANILQNPLNTSPVRLSTGGNVSRQKKKSSLGKEFEPLPDMDLMLYTLESHSDIEDNIEQETLRGLSELDLKSTHYDEEKLSDNTPTDNIETPERPDSGSSFKLLGGKIEEEPIGKGTTSNLDDSVDPLFKLKDNTCPKNVKSLQLNIEIPGPSKPPLHESINTLNNANEEDEEDDEENNATGLREPTLENLVSPNALPPLDNIMKLIYRTSVLVNDSRLMLRCMNCLELSKSLKKTKKQLLSQEIHKLDDELRKSGKMRTNSTLVPLSTNESKLSGNSNSNSNREMPTLLRQRSESVLHQKLKYRNSISNLKNRTGRMNNYSVDQLRRSSSILQQQISPRTSVSLVGTNSILANNNKKASQGSSDLNFENDKGKKEEINNDNTGFPFFAKKK
ncbi:hypothetical protein KAFR_0B02180 [Kazachstania africana CBS 2517]|uniref:Attractin/MKLN-like beta-propeller domain-containing protein n=1 Tax=Kazachstania africana (strain ATCC 22294 / BCRC 22015 / CBS 2517 / CECT 1963 / NBRC 1671 / NRRL Y-8276) TaxID=1071382 RepID=H2AQ66_KAZAF|nr:hypothetical protein KAFR_0B02180 [Kazachstania africana CBS 2517]CCF56516.1 hypothetical protein KAFR_0B02180 [Kazachstania africana CBS 2517]